MLLAGQSRAGLDTDMDTFPDIFGIVGKFGEEREEPLYLTSFEVLEVEEVQDEKLKEVGRPFVRIAFRPRMRLPKLPFDIESTFSASPTERGFTATAETGGLGRNWRGNSPDFPLICSSRTKT